ncbi:hypothetical protein OAU24_00105 [bacterium]|jgi:hypothetical protein|nr:hypothetical protein [bacterium]
MDLDVIKQRLEALQKPTSNNNNNGKSLFWKPSVGKQTVRIVPSKFNKATPFSELYFHYGIGKPVMISPINFDEKDPLVEFAKKLRQTDQPENWKLAKKLEPKVRYFAPVIVRGMEDEGVKIWQFGKELYSSFLSMAMDEEVGDFTDVVAGRDIKLTTEGPEMTGTKYNRTVASPSMKQTPLDADASKVESWLSNQVDPQGVFKQVPYDEMKSNLESWLSPEDAAQEGDIIDDEKEVETPQTNYSLNTSTDNVKQTKLDKFDSLFDDDSSNDLPF